MQIQYSNSKTEKICTDNKKAIKELGPVVAEKLNNLIVAIEAFPRLYDLYVMPQYRLHGLSGDRKYQYSFVLHKGTKWRLIVYPLDEAGEILKDKENEKEMLCKAVKIEIVEVSEHYD